MTTKQKLYVTISNTTKEYKTGLFETKRIDLEQIKDGKKNPNYLQPMKDKRIGKWIKCGNSPIECNSLYTDYFQAVCNTMSFRFVGIALNTIYQKNAHPLIYKLLCSLYEHHEFHNGMETCLDNEYDSLQYKKIHTYKMVKNGDRRYKVEIIPFYTLENTAYGIEYLETIQNYIPNCSCDDLLQTARLAIIELEYYGLINSVADIWSYRNYVYKKIHKAVSAEKKRFDMVETLTVYDKDGNETYYTGKAIDNVMSKVDLQSVKNSIWETIAKRADKRTDLEKMRIVFEMLTQGHTQQTIAKRIKTTQPNVAYYVNKIRHIAECVIRKEEYI